MKIRTGFVSNSSSSSYTCSACGENVIGRDISLSDIEFFECEDGHYICEYGCAPNNWEDGSSDEEAQEFVDEYFQETFNREMKYYENSKNSSYTYYRKQPTEESIKKRLADEFKSEYRYKVPKKYCPVCTFQVISHEEYMPYLLYKLGIKRKDIPEMIREEFNSYDELQKVYKEG